MGKDPPLPHGRPTALPQAEAEEPAGAEQHSPLSNRDFPPMERPTPQGLPPSLMVFYPELGLGYDK